MITIWLKVDDSNFVMIEEVEESLLSSRLAELRTDGLEYHAEKRDGTITSILEV